MTDDPYRPSLLGAPDPHDDSGHTQAIIAVVGGVALMLLAMAVVALAVLA